MTMELQDDLSILEDCNYELYKRYEYLRYEISAIPAMQDLEKPSNSSQRRPFDIEQDLLKVEREIRNIPGFADFQLSLDEEELKKKWLIKGLS